MKGGTEFRFVNEGIHAALEQARAAAGGRDVRLGGGVSTVRQYLRAGLVMRPMYFGASGRNSTRRRQ
jgi:dihydrofolate reductase